MPDAHTLEGEPAAAVSVGRQRKPGSKAALAVGGCMVALAAAAALQTAQSYGRWEFVVLLCGFPVTLAVLCLALAALLRGWRARTLTLRRVAICGGGFALAAGAVFLGIWRWVHPPAIRYEFHYGQSGSWHEVQFFHTEHGREIEGPWVGAWPVRVRFPDLDHDGYPDLRVEGDGDGRIAEYIYLPQNDGKRFWHLVQAKGFSISYPPDGQF